MLNADVLTFQEFVMHETLPHSQIHQAILEFLQGRDDVALFGAQAVNAYVSEPRMTQAVDILSTRAKEVSEELRGGLSERFHIAVRVREIGDGKGFRIYQTRKGGNRHLADIRPVSRLPKTETVEQIRVLSPLELIVSKVISYHARRGKPKSGTDWRDIAVLLIRFPELVDSVGPLLIDRGADQMLITVWNELSANNFELGDEDDEFIF
jgi:hypothetical protein